MPLCIVKGGALPPARDELMQGHHQGLFMVGAEAATRAARAVAHLPSYIRGMRMHIHAYRLQVLPSLVSLAQAR